MRNMLTSVFGISIKYEHGINRILCLFILQGVMIFIQHILETDAV